MPRPVRPGIDIDGLVWNRSVEPGRAFAQASLQGTKIRVQANFNVIRDEMIVDFVCVPLSGKFYRQAEDGRRPVSTLGMTSVDYVETLAGLETEVEILALVEGLFDLKILQTAGLFGFGGERP